MQGSTAKLAFLRKASFSHASMIIICQGHECVCNKNEEVTDINIGMSCEQLILKLIVTSSRLTSTDLPNHVVFQKHMDVV